MIDNTYNAYTQARTSMRDRYRVYNVLDKSMAVKTYIRQWQNRIKSAFKWVNLPDTVPQRALEALLQDEAGYAIFFKEGENFYVDFGGLGGTDENVNYEVSKGIITNAPLNLERTVYFKNNLKNEQDAVLIRNVPDILTCEELVFSRYAKLLAETDITLELALMQSRAMLMMMAEDDDQLKAIDNYIKNIETGNIVSIKTDNTTTDEAIKVQPYSTSMHQALTDINECYQFLKASMLQDMGISANNNNKRESIMSSESELITSGLTTLIDTMYNCRKEACEEINTLFGLNIDVQFDGVWKRAILQDNVLEEEDDKEIGGTENVESMGEDTTEEGAESSGGDAEGGSSEAEEEQEEFKEGGEESGIEIKIEAENVTISNSDEVSVEEDVTDNNTEETEETDDAENSED